MLSTPAAGIFAVLTMAAVLFQIALAAGMPWGKLAMGGRFPGKLPLAMRVAAIAQAAVLLLVAAIILVRAETVLPDLHASAAKAAWVVVAFCSLSLVLNLITPSKWERIVWAPVAFVMTVCSLIVAFGM